MGKDKYAEEIEEVAKEFIAKYGENERYTKDIHNKLSSWINNIDNEEIQKMWLSMFRNFIFIGKQEIKEHMKSVFINILTYIGNAIDTTNIVPVESRDGSINSSNDMIGLIHELIIDEEIPKGLDIYSDTILNSASFIKNDITDVILLDDISGTGGTIKKFIEKYEVYLKDKTIYLGLIVITKTAKQFLEEYSCTSGIKIVIEAPLVIDSCFNDGGIFNENDKASLKELEEQLFGKKSDYVLGYKASAILVGFSHNIPNNTIGSLWIEKDYLKLDRDWNTLFKRRVKRRRPQQRPVVNEYNKERKKGNYWKGKEKKAKGDKTR